MRAMGWTTPSEYSGLVAQRLAGLLALIAMTLLSGCPAPPPAVPDSPGGAPTGPPSGAGTSTDGPGSADAGTATGEDTAAGQRTEWGDPDGLPIGGYMSLTGDISAYGTSSNMGMGQAVEEINAAGGVLDGRPLRLIMADAGSKQDEAVNAARRLLDREQVKVLVGEVASSLSLAVAPIAQEAAIPMLSPSSTNPTVTGKGDYIFRSCFTDDLQGAYVAKFALDQGYRRAALLTDMSQDYSKGLAAVIEREFAAGGGEVVVTQNYQGGDKDFNAPLTDLKNREVDVVFIPGYYAEAALIIKQARDLGIEAALVGADGWDGPDVEQVNGPRLNDRCYFVNHYSKSDPSPQVAQFVEAFRSRYGIDPDAMAATAYDGMRLVADAINRAGSDDPRAIRDALAATSGFEGVTGTITIDAQRNAVKPCVVLGWENGEQVVVTRMQPGDIGAG